MHIWKPIAGFYGYEINNLGCVRSIDRLVNFKSYKKFSEGRILKKRVNNFGYISVSLSLNGLQFTRFIHRLLAQEFIANPDNKKFVNHVNGVKTDNQIENLEWVTASENMQHAYSTGLCKVPKTKHEVIDICTGYKFDSIRSAADYYSIPYSSCKNALRGIRKNNTCLRLAS